LGGDSLVNEQRVAHCRRQSFPLDAPDSSISLSRNEARIDGSGAFDSAALQLGLPAMGVLALHFLVLTLSGWFQREQFDVVRYSIFVRSRFRTVRGEPIRSSPTILLAVM